MTDTYRVVIDNKSEIKNIKVTTHKINQKNVTKFLRGPEGTSAYQAALSNGFVGTSSEWVESLKGKSAYGVALDNGFVGTEQEWLDSLKATLDIEIRQEEKDFILTNDGQDYYWASIEQKLNSSDIIWDLGEY